MSKMVPLPTNSIIPERDLDKIPVLETVISALTSAA